MASRSSEFPWGRCSGCGYSGSSLESDHGHDDHDLLCGSCLKRMNDEKPWVVRKMLRATGEVFSEYRHRHENSAAATLKRIQGNPEALEDGRFVVTMDHQDNLPRA